jgi:hypothetical protein
MVLVEVSVVDQDHDAVRGVLAEGLSVTEARRLRPPGAVEAQPVRAWCPSRVSLPSQSDIAGG